MGALMMVKGPYEIGLVEGSVTTPHEVERAREIRKECEALPELSVDSEFIKTCLYNVILNAFQAMPEGGTLTIRTTKTGEKFSIVVEDTGIGISEEKAGRIFDPFFTTKGQGLGLGLALTKRIIEEHKGKVDFKSVVGKGSTITMILPIEKEEVCR